ncbi:invasion associated locus B family protein [uncultured Sphingomonas sp.]|uniref:invasion associated locus B family protein n=1 Tax=uncultured Sphingomonas sp. TaxID=158754 RepID=UPI0035C981B8
MKPALLALTLAALATPVAAAGPGAGRTTIGIYEGWGAFRDAAPARCYAIARPIAAEGRSGGFASVATWPGRGLRNSLYVRLSRERDRSAGVTLSVGDRRFALVATGVDAWATDAPSDRALVAAIRGGRSMSVEAVGVGGRPFADVYALGGAATAIDAAALGCARN